MEIIFKILFIIASAFFGIFLGAGIGVTYFDLFAQADSHGMQGILGIIIGGAVGLMMGAISSIFLIFKFPKANFKKGFFLSALGAVFIFILIQIADHFNYW